MLSTIGELTFCARTEQQEALQPLSLVEFCGVGVLFVLLLRFDNSEIGCCR
jgi:hypothetical protein